MKNFFIKSVFAFLFLANAMLALADGTINVSDGTGEGSGWNYESGTITISEAGTFTLTGSTTTNSVVIAVSVDTFNVTLENVSIETACPFYITPNTSAKNTTVNLTLTGVNTLTSKSGGNAGLSVHANAAVHIYGTGSLYATGSLNGEDGGAGIGSKYSSNSGKITVHSGTVTATSIDKAAAIGAGYHGSQASGPVTISGGVVCCINKSRGFSIGHYNGSGGACYISGNAVVIVNSSIYDTNASRRTGGVLLEGDKCTFYGTDIVLTNDLLLPTGKILTVPEENSFTTSEGTTVTNNGTVIVDGTLNINGNCINNETITVNGVTANTGVIENYKTITIYGSLTNSGVIRNHGDGVIQGSINGNPVEVKQYTVNVSTVSQSGEGYTFANGIVTLTTADALYTLTGTSTTTRVSVAENITVNVIFQNLNIESTDVPFAIGASSNVKLKLEDTNTLSSASAMAINESSNAKLTITGTGSLTATGSTAGIGGSGITTVNDGLLNASSISGTFKMAGNAVIFTDVVTDNTSKTSGVLFVGEEGTTYGELVSTAFDYTIPAGKTLTVDDSKSLYIVAGKTVTNNGTINVFGKLQVLGTLTNNGTIYDFRTVEGNITGNPVQTGERNKYTIDLSTVNASGTGYTLSGTTLTLTEKNAEYTLTGTTTNKQIVIASGIALIVVLDNTSITSGCPIFVNPNSILNLTLTGNNVLKSNVSGKAAISVPTGAKIIIDGTGSLLAEATKFDGQGHCGAGIGGNNETSAGVIIVNNGTITAVSYAKAAGIGGGYHGANGTGYEEITINGGFVTAKSLIFAGTQGDGIGGYGTDNQVLLGKFSIQNAIVFASNIRDKKQHQNSIVFDDRNGVIYGESAVIDRDIELAPYTILKVKADQTLTINAGATLTLPQNTLLTSNSGANLVINGAIVGYKETSFEDKGASITGADKINVSDVGYDNRDRLYLDFHIIKTITGVSNPGTLSAQGITTTTNTIVSWERFMEGLFPNINVVVNIDTLETSGVIQGPRNHAIQVNIGNYSIPGAAGTYHNNTIEVPVSASGWNSLGVVIHEYFHHTTSYVTGSDPDDGRSFEQLYQDWASFRANQYWQMITNANNIGEAWDGDNVWLRSDPKTQARPECTFPEYFTINQNTALSTAKFSEPSSGNGTFRVTNGGYKPSINDNGTYKYRMEFIPDDQTNYHIVTKDVQIRFAGIKLPVTIFVQQDDIPVGITPSPKYSTDPENLEVLIEYKVQGASNSTYTTVAPTSNGSYTVRASFSGDDTYEAASAMYNFKIGTGLTITNPDTRQQVAVYAGEGVIRIIAENGVSNAVLRVYSLSGSLVASKYISAGETDISIRRGLYIINCEGVRKKVIVR